MNLKRGQLAFEFVILVGFIMVSFVLFLAIIQGNMSEKIRDRNDAFVKEIALIVKNEIDLALESGEGYNRNFVLPTDVYGKNYDLWINDSILFVETTDQENIFSIPIYGLNGQIKLNENNIRKENGEIYLNL